MQSSRVSKLNPFTIITFDGWLNFINKSINIIKKYDFLIQVVNMILENLKLMISITSLKIITIIVNFGKK